MIISIIAAMDAERGIGFENGMPWARKVPADMQNFVALTTGHLVIMGHATYTSMGGALKNRHNIVLSRQPELKLPDAGVCNSLQDALKAAAILYPHADDEIFIIGGGKVYAEAINIADRMYLTKFDETFVCDTFFPPLELFKWRHLKDKDLHIPKDDKNQFGMQFFTFERTRSLTE